MRQGDGVELPADSCGVARPLEQRSRLRMALERRVVVATLAGDAAEPAESPRLPGDVAAVAEEGCRRLGFGGRDRVVALKKRHTPDSTESLRPQIPAILPGLRPRVHRQRFGGPGPTLGIAPAQVAPLPHRRRKPQRDVGRPVSHRPHHRRIHVFGDRIENPKLNARLWTREFGRGGRGGANDELGMAPMDRRRVVALGKEVSRDRPDQVQHPEGRLTLPVRAARDQRRAEERSEAASRRRLVAADDRLGGPLAEGTGEDGESGEELALLMAQAAAAPSDDVVQETAAQAESVIAFRLPARGECVTHGVGEFVGGIDVGVCGDEFDREGEAVDEPTDPSDCPDVCRWQGLGGVAHHGAEEERGRGGGFEFGLGGGARGLTQRDQGKRPLARDLQALPGGDENLDVGVPEADSLDELPASIEETLGVVEHKHEPPVGEMPDDGFEGRPLRESQRVGHAGEPPVGVTDGADPHPANALLAVRIRHRRCAVRIRHRRCGEPSLADPPGTGDSHDARPAVEESTQCGDVRLPPEDRIRPGGQLGGVTARRVGVTQQP